MVDEPAELQALGPDGLTSAEAWRLERLRQQVEAAIPTGDPLVTPVLGALYEEVRALIAGMCVGTTAGATPQGESQPQFAVGACPAVPALKGSLAAWLCEMKAWFVLCEAPVPSRVGIAAMRSRRRVREYEVVLYTQEGVQDDTWDFFTRSLTTLYGEVHAELNARNQLDVIRMVDDDFEDYVRHFIVAEVRQDERHGSSPASQQQMETAYIVLEVIVHNMNHVELVKSVEIRMNFPVQGGKQADEGSPRCCTPWV
eukprot:SM000121S26006  [mRNA]  locus=s121:255627:256418:- [translate_table: standard]